MKFLFFLCLCSTCCAVDADFEDLVRRVQAASATSAARHFSRSSSSSSMSFSSSFGSNVSVGSAPFEFDDHPGFGSPKSLDERIAEAENKLNRLKFIKNVCPALESVVSVDIKEKSFSDAIIELETVLGAKIPYTIKTDASVYKNVKINMTINKSDGMRVLQMIAGQCKLLAKYKETQIEFVK